jgi:hypothetical protein
MKSEKEIIEKLKSQIKALEEEAYCAKRGLIRSFMEKPTL